MQVSVESTSTLGRKMTVQIPPERIDPEIEKRLKSISGSVKLDGFRPGKVPLKVVKQRFGDQVMREVMGEVLQSSFREAVSQEKLRPAGGPDIDAKTMAAGEGLEYTATFEVYPEFTVADFAKIKVVRPVTEITDADVDKVLESLRKQRRTWEPVERPAKLEDQVVMDFSGRIGDEPFEGGAGEDFTLELGTKQLIPGFEDQLVGVKAGEERTLSLTFPDDYKPDHLAGKDASFDVKVKTVSEGHLPALDEEFARAFGVQEGGVETLKAEISGNMERELAERIEQKVKQQAMDGLYELNKFDVPEALIAREIENAREQLHGSMGPSSDAPDLPDSLFEGQARKRVSLGLIINEIVKQLGLSPDADKVRQRVDTIASTYGDPARVAQYYQQDHDARGAVEAFVLEGQVVERVLQDAVVTDAEIEFDELMKAETS
ncbi:MAG: trigger factor [Gammaproteobacteria bacterium]